MSPGFLNLKFRIRNNLWMGRLRSVLRMSILDFDLEIVHLSVMVVVTWEAMNFGVCGKIGAWVVPSGCIPISLEYLW